MFICIKYSSSQWVTCEQMQSFPPPPQKTQILCWVRDRLTTLATQFQQWPDKCFQIHNHNRKTMVSPLWMQCFLGIRSCTISVHGSSIHLIANNFWQARVHLGFLKKPRRVLSLGWSLTLWPAAWAWLYTCVFGPQSYVFSWQFFL